MKQRIMAGLLLLCLALSLCACGEKEETTASVPGVDAQSGAWIGQGGCFTAERARMPKGALAVGEYEGELYALTMGMESCTLYRGETEIKRIDGFVYDACAVKEGFWLNEDLYEDGRASQKLSLLSFTGETIRQLTLTPPDGTILRKMYVTNSRICFNSSDALLLYDLDGTLKASIPHGEWQGELLMGGDGAVYYLEDGAVYAINEENARVELLFSVEQGTLSCGDGETPFFRIQSEGIYRMHPDGSAAPLVLWEECGLAISGVSEVLALDGGRYLLTGENITPLLLSPAAPSEIKPRVILTLGVLPADPRVLQFSSLSAAVSAFNAESPDLTIKLEDLTDGGTFTVEAAISRLNTRIAAGDGPDMLFFQQGPGALSPFPLIHQGLLRDLSVDVEADPDMTLADILPAEAIARDCGGLYLLAESFSIDSRVGLKSRFGDRWGWRFDEYLEMDRSRPEDSLLMYNITRDYFLEQCAARFARSAIDWKSGTCDFQNRAFADLLETSKSIRENPEDPNNMVFGLPWTMLHDGYLLTDAVFINSVGSLAAYRQSLGEDFSVIGWPTPDGSCGSDFRLSESIAVLTASRHPAECWRFLKYVLTQSEQTLPCYRPLLDEKIEAARNRTDDSEPLLYAEMLKGPISESDAALLTDLLSHIEHTTLYDQTALDIIKEESAACFDGAKSAEETAAMVQSRISIYVSERH